jgi:uncharacterized protein (TIGR03437 family)
VALTSSDPLLAAPQTIIVSGNTTTASFRVTAASVITSNQNATVTASLDGSTRSTTIALQAGSVLPQGGLTVSPSSLSLLASGSHAVSQNVLLASTVPEDQFTAAVTTAGGGNWLTVSPASGPLSSQTGVTVMVDSTGAAPGIYKGEVNFSTGSGASASLAVTVSVKSAGRLIVSPTTLHFTWDPNDPLPPPAQGVAIFSDLAGAAFTATAPGTDNWLKFGAKTAGTVPGSLAVYAAPADLAPGTYTSQISITSAADSVWIPVTLTVLGRDPQFSVSSGTQNFTLPEGANPASGQIVVQNAGGGTLQFSAETSTEQGSWLNLSGSLGTASSTESAALGFTVDPRGLAPGFYTGQIAVHDSASRTQSVTPVRMAVSQTATLTASQTGLTFSAVAGGPVPPPQSFIVNTQDDAGTKLSTQVRLVPNPRLSQTSWLSATSFSAAGSGNTEVTAAVNTFSLAPGEYYGSIEVSATDVSNAPLIVSVLLNVLPATAASPGVQLSTGGLLFFERTAESATSQQEQIGIFNPTSEPLSWSASVFTSDSSGWLLLPQSRGTLAPGSNIIDVQATFESFIAPGVKTGTIFLAFGDGSTSVVDVKAFSTQTSAALFRLPTRYSAGKAASGNIGTGCPEGHPNVLLPLFQSPANSSTVHTAIAQTLRIYVLDDCGNALSQANGGAVQVIFSDGDPSIDLHDIGGGVWEATWVPQTADAEVLLKAVASRNSSGLNPLTSEISVTVDAEAISASPQLYRVVNAAIGGGAPPQVAVPGSYVAVYGKNLSAPGSVSASAVPLPSNLNGAQLLLGGQALPMYYASPAQINALIPESLNVNTEYQLIVLQGSTESVPIPLILTKLQPGIYSLDASGSGQGVVEIAGTSLLAGPAGSASRPVQSGSEYLVAYCSGLGSVADADGGSAPAAGFATPSSGLYRTAAHITATLGGISVPVTFAGLAPTLVGIFQVNIQVPAGVPTGDAVPLVISATDPESGIVTTSNSVAVAVQ